MCVFLPEITFWGSKSVLFLTLRVVYISKFNHVGNLKKGAEVKNKNVLVFSLIESQEKQH